MFWSTDFNIGVLNPFKHVAPLINKHRVRGPPTVQPEPCARLLASPPKKNPDGALSYQQAFRQQRAFSSHLQISPLIASLNVINLVFSPKADRWKQCVELTASQHSLCLHCPQQSGNFSYASNKNEFIGI